MKDVVNVCDWSSTEMSIGTNKDYIEQMLSMTAEESNLTGNEKSEVTEFYDGLNILVTGGSGFLGRLLVEKFLRCCPKIGKLYMLMRTKRGKSAEERFKEYFDDSLYERLKYEQPSFASKVSIIEGDTGKKDLGLSLKNRELLIKTVHVVFHGAATVNFQEKLRLAININMRGLILMLQLARKMDNLKAFVHISTAFAPCAVKEIEEKFYPPPMEIDRLFNLLDNLNDRQLEHVTPLLLGDWPNTYTFSKAMAEEAGRKYSSGLPFSVVRPSIVISTWKEPIAAWTNNIYGATGVTIGCGVGLLRTLHCKPTNSAEIIPADFVVNNIVVAAWDTAEQWMKQSIIKEPSIYNCVSSSRKPITWNTFLKLNAEYGLEVPSSYCIWHYMLLLNEHLWLHNLCIIFLHLVPAAIADFILYILGKKPM